MIGYEEINSAGMMNRGRNLIRAAIKLEEHIREMDRNRENRELERGM